MADGDVVGRDVDRRARHGQHAVVPRVPEALEEHALVDEDARLVTVDHVEVEQLRVEEARRPRARHDGPSADRLDVPHRPRQLAVDLGPHEGPHLVGGHVVDHRVPDRPAVLQPVQVDGTVGAQRVEVGRAAVVLVDETGRAVAHHERRVTTWPVRDAGLDVDGDDEAVEVELLAVGRADEVREPEAAHLAVELAGRVAGKEDADVARQVLAQPRLVPVIAVEVGDVQEVGRLDARQQVVVELVVAREREPGAEERRDEPRVAHDRAAVRLDQDPGVPDGGRPHGRGDRPRQATGGSVYCWPLRDTCSVHAEPSQ